MPDGAALEKARAENGSSQAILTVDLDALAANWRFLAGRVRGAECAGVVKADAYGLGLAPVAKALWVEGCRTFFVAHLGEGENLRALRSGCADFRAQRPGSDDARRFTRGRS